MNKSGNQGMEMDLDISKAYVKARREFFAENSSKVWVCGACHYSNLRNHQIDSILSLKVNRSLGDFFKSTSGL